MGGRLLDPNIWPRWTGREYKYRPLRHKAFADLYHDINHLAIPQSIISIINPIPLLSPTRIQVQPFEQLCQRPLLYNHTMHLVWNPPQDYRNRPVAVLGAGVLGRRIGMVYPV